MLAGGGEAQSMTKQGHSTVASMHKIILPERCDRAAAEALLPEFVAALGGGLLHVDATATRQCGQAMLQLLVSARRTGEGARIDPSPALLDVALLCGLDGELFDEVILPQGATA